MTAERTHDVAAESGLDAMVAPTAIAVVGASRTRGKLGAAMAEAVSAYTAPVALVNPASDGMHDTVQEAACGFDVPIDLAVLCVPASATPEALDDAARAGARVAIVCAGGFAETGISAGSRYQKDVEDVVRRTGIRLLGPNTSGFFVPRSNLFASFVPGVASITPGPIGVVSSSGGVNHALSFRLHNAGVGISAGVGLGAAVDVCAADVVDYLTYDPDTSVIALHMETVTDGEGLVSALRRASRQKAVVALVVGQSDVAEFAQSHTGALATSRKTARSVLEQNGAVCVDSEDELIDVAVALSGGRMVAHPDPGIGVITAQAGPGLLIHDYLTNSGVNVPRLSDSSVRHLADLLPPVTYQQNPVDTGRPGPEFSKVVRTVASDECIHAVGVYALIEPVVDLPCAVTGARVRDVPTVIGVDGLEQDLHAAKTAAAAQQLPILTGPTALARGLSGLVRDSVAQHAIQRSVRGADPVIAGTGPWDEERAKRIIQKNGINIPASRRVKTREEAHTAFTELNGYVTAKILDENVLHKTEEGGVILGIGTTDEFNDALTSLIAAGAREFLIEEMAPPGIDLIVGAHRDKVFGPVVSLGVGGIAVEALADVALRRAPIRDGTAESMINELTNGDVLRGWRGGPAVDTDEMDRILSVLGTSLEQQPHISEIEINPLRLTSSGLIALDAVIVGTSAAV